MILQHSVTQSHILS